MHAYAMLGEKREKKEGDPAWEGNTISSHMWSEMMNNITIYCSMCSAWKLKVVYYYCTLCKK